MVTFQYFLSELQSALTNGYFKNYCHLREDKTMLDFSYREILLDMAVQNVVGD